MTMWSYDISAAPRGKMVTQTVTVKGEERVRDVFVPAKVILATKCGKVTLSHYIPDEDRWLMLASGEHPVAWQAWPEHPSKFREDAA